MVTIYYPSGSKIEERNTASGSYVVATLNVPSNAIFWFDTSGSISSSIITIDSSSYSMNASTASVSLNSISSSYALTASIAISSSYLSGSVIGSGVTTIQQISASAYYALANPNPNTLYIITN